jgi:hypothetical protein
MERRLRLSGARSMSQAVSLLIGAAVLLMAGAGWIVARVWRARNRRAEGGRTDGGVLEPAGALARSTSGLVLGVAPSRLDARPLSSDESVRFSKAWRAVQARFIDDPNGAVTEADRLVGELLYARAFPLGEMDEYAEDITQEYPRLMRNYRLARSIARRHANGQTTTEDLRQAFVAYRALFDDLLDTKTPLRNRQRWLAKPD